jgi:hypothetical protein
MKPDTTFSTFPPRFWSAVRYVSQEAGYASAGTAISHSATEIAAIFTTSNLNNEFLAETLPSGSTMRNGVVDYLHYRACLLNERVKPCLMDADEARRLCEGMEKELEPSCPLPMNKQKGAKRTRAFLTCIVNMLIEHHTKGYPVDYDPRRLALLTHQGRPEATLSRRLDGCFPSTTDPRAVWEIKEYYYTTTFGSRVADGVYESLLDGLELRDAQTRTGRVVDHYLFLDGKYTWWHHGIPYLSRIVDMLNMGLVDEVLVGREVSSRLPEIASGWVADVQ